MDCPDFDSRFNLYLKEWIDEHADEYDDMDDAIEELGYEIYNRWLNTKADWLNGEAPGFYFQSFTDAVELIAILEEYIKQEISLPAPLLESIASFGMESHQLLVKIVGDSSKTGALRMTALGLLQEIDIPVQAKLYTTIIAEADGNGPLAYAAAEALESLNSAEAINEILASMEEASFSVRLCLMNPLSNFRRDSRIVKHALALFKEAQKERDRALIAAYLAKLGDDSVLPALYDAALETELPYLVYVEIRDAIDALGGDPAPEREFSGDPMYEALRGL